MSRYYRMLNMNVRSYFKIKDGLRNRLLDSGMSVRKIGEIESKVGVFLNNSGLKNSSVSYRIIIRNYSYEVNIVSKNEGDEEYIKEVINDLRSKGKKVIGKMESFKKMYGNYRNYDKKYRVWLSNINGIWNENKKRILVCKGEDHPFNKICKMEDEYGYEEDEELFRELYNWKKFVKYDRV